MATGPAARRQIEAGGSLDALGTPGKILEITAAGQFGSDLVRSVSMRFVAVADAHDADGGVEQRAAADAPLIAQVGEPGDGIAFCGALLGRQRGDAVVG